MAEYWKSTRKHHCAICNIWLPAHPRSIAAHNASELHNSKKDHALQKLEREAADAAAKERSLSSQLQAIEAAAIQSMKRQIDGIAPQTQQTAEVPLLSLREVMSRIQPPSLSHRDKQEEMQRLEAFIGERVSKTSVLSSDASQTNVKTEPITAAPLIASYFADSDEIPDIIKKDPQLLIEANWLEQIHESTGVPIWFFPKRNLYVWSKPSFLPEENSHKLELKKETTTTTSVIPITGSSQKRSRHASQIKEEEVIVDGMAIEKKTSEEPDLKQIVETALALAKTYDDEGVPGQWQVVEAGKEMTNRDAIFVKPTTESDSVDLTLDNLLGSNKTSGPSQGGTSATIIDKYDAVDLERIDRTHYGKVVGNTEPLKRKIGFKKRRTALDKAPAD